VASGTYTTISIMLYADGPHQVNQVFKNVIDTLSDDESDGDSELLMVVATLSMIIARGRRLCVQGSTNPRRGNVKHSPVKQSRS
jgi:hypothetical protein